MKIGIDIRSLMNGRYSGVGWYTFNLLDNLFKIDQENHYILFYNSSRPVELPKFDHPNVSYYGSRWPNKLFNLSLNFFSYPQLDKLIGGVDVFFSPNLHFISCSKGCRLVLAVHDLSFYLFPEFFTLKSRWWHRLILAKNILLRADIILTDSFSTKQDLVNQLAIKEQKVAVINLGVSGNFFNLAGDKISAVKQKYNLPEKFILFLGTIEPRKNVAGLIEAFNQLDSDRQLVIAGSHGWKTRLVDKLAQGNNKILFLNYVEEGDKPYLYHLADLFVYPSYYEGFGLPILEAMAAGCPVIAGSNSSQGEVLGDAGLLVNAFDVKEIKTAIESILLDDNLRQELKRRGQERAKNFIWEKTAQETLKIFQANLKAP